MIEYVLKVALIVVLSIGALSFLGKKIADRLCDSAGKVGTATHLSRLYPGYYDPAQNACCVAITELFGSPIYHCE